MGKSSDKFQDALIFIDTNIFLDFYKIAHVDITMKFLERIDEHKDRIITSRLVEMEYKKNRQRVILRSIYEVKSLTDLSFEVPGIVSDEEAASLLKKAQKAFIEQQNALQEKTEKILTAPSENDPIYQSLEKLFNHQSKVHLTSEHDKLLAIQELAQQRFIQGFPPRKKDDNTMGDSVNWEWIIHCVEVTQKPVIIVTRDKDFGIFYENHAYLNDWLRQEFEERVGQDSRLMLTNKLTHAFQLADITVTDEMIEEDERTLNSSGEN